MFSRKSLSHPKAAKSLLVYSWLGGPYTSEMHGAITNHKMLHIHTSLVYKIYPEGIFDPGSWSGNWILRCDLLSCQWAGEGDPLPACYLYF